MITKISKYYKYYKERDRVVEMKIMHEQVFGQEWTAVFHIVKFPYKDHP